MEPTDMLTGAERVFVAHMGEAWDQLCAIVGDADTRDADLAEAIVHVHALQHMVLSQAAARAYPGQYRPLGQSLRRKEPEPAPIPGVDPGSALEAFLNGPVVHMAAPDGVTACGIAVNTLRDGDTTSPLDVEVSCPGCGLVGGMG